MKKATKLIIGFFIIILLLSDTSAFASFAGGDGTSGNPYQIANVNQLQEMKDHLSSCFVLINDIDASATASWNSGAGFDPIGDYSTPGDYSTTFTGAFDGQGHKIVGLYINRPGENFLGLFGCTGSGAEITDVGVDGNITGLYYVGGLVGWMIFSGEITSCYSTGSVRGVFNLGGLVGCSSGTITSCYSTSNVSCSDIYPIGSYAGGLVGQNSNSCTITSCYSTGSVTSDTTENVGGLVGKNYGTVTSCFWDIDTSGQTTSAGGTGKTDAYMVQQATFVGWDFTNTWSIVEGKSYPFLQSLGNSHIKIFVSSLSDLKTDEYGLSLELIIRLGSKPASDVTIDVMSSDTSEGVVSVSSLTFDASNWYGQTVTVTGVDDGVTDGDQAYSIIFSPAVSSDPNYDGVDPDDVCLINYEPIPIGNINDLQNISLDLSGYYALVGDIDASETVNWNSGKGFDPIGASSAAPFTGTLYGNGYEITGFYINRSGESCLGLFGYTGAGAVIADVGMEVNITGDQRWVGSHAGYNYGTITNCYSRGTVNGGLYHTGGLVGYNIYGDIKNCYSSCSVNGGIYYTGGLVGENDHGAITNCYSSCSVSAGSYYTGGLVGQNTGGDIINCYNTGSVSDGSFYTGGLVGVNSGTVTSCFWNTDTSGQATSAGGIGKTNTEMMQQATFSGWDFTDIWNIYENNTCPFFIWDLDIDHDGITNTDETDIYGTIPYAADSDNDGVDDGDELIYWGADWNTDYDGDSGTYPNNLLDPDADNDGFTDGLEIKNGSAPDDAGSTPDIYPNMINWNGNLVADFGDNGLWYHNGTNWNWMSNRGHVNQMMVWDGKLAVDFGVAYGMYYYDGSWHWMTNKGVVAKMTAWNNGATEKLVVDFGGGRRIYTYDGSWHWFSNKDSANDMTVWNNRLVVDFGAGRGVYNNNGTWNWMSNKDDIARMVAWNNGSAERLVVDFGGGRRVYTYNGAWSWLTNKDDVNDMAVWNNKLVVDFGSGRCLYNYDTSWHWMSNKDDVAKMVVWNDGTDKLAVDFGGGRGIYYYDGSWHWMKNADDVPEMIAWGTRLAVDFGSGTGIYNYNGAWHLMRTWSTAE